VHQETPVCSEIILDINPFTFICLSSVPPSGSKVGKLSSFQQSQLEVPRPSEPVDSGELDLPLAPSTATLLGTLFHFRHTPFFSLVSTPSELKFPSKSGEFDCVMVLVLREGRGGLMR
jgi:hypothetical protein